MHSSDAFHGSDASRPTPVRHAKGQTGKGRANERASQRALLDRYGADQRALVGLAGGSARRWLCARARFQYWIWTRARARALCSDLCPSPCACRRWRWFGRIQTRRGRAAAARVGPKQSAAAATVVAAVGRYGQFAFRASERADVCKRARIDNAPPLVAVWAGKRAISCASLIWRRISLLSADKQQQERKRPTQPVSHRPERQEERRRGRRTDSRARLCRAATAPAADATTATSTDAAEPK